MNYRLSMKLWGMQQQYSYIYTIECMSDLQDPSNIVLYYPENANLLLNCMWSGIDLQNIVLSAMTFHMNILV